jgi:predicted metal-dependent enzyme (double-stranded beta helix superfamily)
MMTPLLALLMALMPAQAQQARNQKQLIDNPQVTVWDATWEKGKSSGTHRHQYDTIVVELADAGGFRKGAVSFVAKGTSHDEPGATDAARHAIMVDLKEPAVPPMPNKSGYPDAFPRDGARKILDNARVTVWDLAFVLGKPTPTHFHGKDVVVVYLENGDSQSTTPDGKKTVSANAFGQVKFNARNRTHSELLVKGAQRVIAVELK